MILNNIIKLNFKKDIILLLVILPLIIFIIKDSQAKNDAANQKKQLYIAKITAKNVPDKMADKVRDQLKLAILQKHADEYYINDDNSLRQMFSISEKLFTMKNQDEGTIAEIAKTIDADEIIYGEVLKSSGKIILQLNNLSRDKSSNTGGIKSTVLQECFESQLDHFIQEAGWHLINPSYIINTNAPQVFDPVVHIKPIKINEMKGSEIKVIEFKTSDEVLARILDDLKAEIAEGDKYLSSRTELNIKEKEKYETLKMKDQKEAENYKKEMLEINYDAAITVYKEIITKIETKLSADRKKQLAGLVKEIKNRIEIVTFKQRAAYIEKNDKKISDNKNITYDDYLEHLCSYFSMYTSIENDPQIISLLQERIDSVLSVLIGIKESRSDTAYNSYNFQEAYDEINDAVILLDQYQDSRIKKSEIKRLSMKRDTIIKTGKNYTDNQLLSLMNVIEYKNYKGEDFFDQYEAVCDILFNSPFISQAAYDRFMKNIHPLITTNIDKRSIEYFDYENLVVDSKNMISIRNNYEKLTKEINTNRFGLVKIRASAAACNNIKERHFRRQSSFLGAYALAIIRAYEMIKWPKIEGSFPLNDAFEHSGIAVSSGSEGVLENHKIECAYGASDYELTGFFASVSLNNDEVYLGIKDFILSEGYDLKAINSMYSLLLKHLSKNKNIAISVKYNDEDDTAYMEIIINTPSNLKDNYNQNISFSVINTAFDEMDDCEITYRIDSKKPAKQYFGYGVAAPNSQYISKSQRREGAYQGALLMAKVEIMEQFFPEEYKSNFKTKNSE